MTIQIHEGHPVNLTRNELWALQLSADAETIPHFLFDDLQNASRKIKTVIDQLQTRDIRDLAAGREPTP